MTKEIIAKLRIWSLLIILVSAVGINFVFARDDNDLSKGVTISPPIMEFNLDPGETVDGKIRVNNPLDHEVKVYPLVYDFVARGERGEQEFIAPTAEDRTYSLASWISYTRSVITLATHQVDFLNFTIQTPEDAEPGGHYGVIFFSTASPNTELEKGKISITGMVGALILTTVSGDIKENAKIVTYSASRFSLKGPVKFVTRIENLGNVHFKPKGSINIFDYKGENVDSITFNETMGNVLPESIRRFDKEIWDNEGRWGRFKAQLSVTYGENHKNLGEELIFWIIPLYMLIIAGLVLILLVIGIVWLVRRRKARARFHKPEPERPKRIIQ